MSNIQKVILERAKEIHHRRQVAKYQSYALVGAIILAVIIFYNSVK